MTKRAAEFFAVTLCSAFPEILITSKELGLRDKLREPTDSQERSKKGKSVDSLWSE